VNWKTISILFAVVIVTAVSPVWGEGNNVQFFSRPIPLGVDGQNGAVNFDQTTGTCLFIDGTLGSLVSDGTYQYILGAAHVLALGQNGYFASGSGEPVIQPNLQVVGVGTNTPPPQGYPLASCPPTAADITAYQVAALSTVIPINFSKGAVNTYDAALAKVLPGQVGSSIPGLKPSTFSGTPISSLKRGTKVQKVGAWSGVTSGRYEEIMKTVHYSICSHTYTKGTDAHGAVLGSCNPVEVKFGPHIVVTPGSLASPGDSGALVFTQGSCPQPIGVAVGKKSSVVYVAPLASVGSVPGVLQDLQTAAGSSASFTVVPGGGGCTATNQIEVELDDGTTADVDGTVPDADIQTALTARNDFLSSGWIPVLIDDGVVDGVAIDFSTNPASLDVTANDGTYDGVDDKTMAAELLPTSFEGVPVEFSVTDVIDLTASGVGYGS
jgi:hypothetical protein